MAYEFEEGLGGAAQGATIGTAFVPGIGTAIGAGIGAVGGYFSGRSRRRRERRNIADINRAYGEAEQDIRGGFAGARDIYGQTAETLRGVYGKGFGRVREEIGGGFARGREELLGGFERAKAEYTTPEMLQMKANLFKMAMGEGGLAPEEIERQKAEVGDVYAGAGRELLRERRGFAGMSQAPGLSEQQLAEGFGRLGQRRASDIRGIESEAEALRREDIARGQEGMMRFADTMAGLEERMGTAMGNLTIQEAVEMGRLSESEMNALADLEQSLGENMANMTLNEALQLAQLGLNRQAQIMAASGRPSSFTQTLAPITAGATQALVAKYGMG